MHECDRDSGRRNLHVPSRESTLLGNTDKEGLGKQFEWLNKNSTVLAERRTGSCRTNTPGDEFVSGTRGPARVTDELSALRQHRNDRFLVFPLKPLRARKAAIAERRATCACVAGNVGPELAGIAVKYLSIAGI
ncbi:hypothetical protein EVAR_88270_1 [Eumeta japonica]|uniref:Uncharacterized protein n=1 Tax=Eumeta variegata TaxID=151549 RepID=A0A4C1XPZ4_EUMVA|nr:hypothetical protein EVAR_88270_1 [Eumeta japonica]